MCVDGKEDSFRKLLHAQLPFPSLVSLSTALRDPPNPQRCIRPPVWTQSLQCKKKTVGGLKPQPCSS